MAPHRAIGERVLAWIYTGPVGHLWSPLADIATLWARWIVQRVRTRAVRTRG
jgi:hypothetical protein